VQQTTHSRVRKRRVEGSFIRQRGCRSYTVCLWKKRCRSRIRSSDRADVYRVQGRWLGRLGRSLSEARTPTTQQRGNFEAQGSTSTHCIHAYTHKMVVPRRCPSTVALSRVRSTNPSQSGCRFGEPDREQNSVGVPTFAKTCKNLQKPVNKNKKKKPHAATLQ
jgi:hypothetical protein